jgi:hypothetical protein
MRVQIIKSKAPIQIWSGYLNAPQSYRDELVKVTKREKNKSPHIDSFYDVFNEKNGKVVATNYYAWEAVPLYKKLLENIEKSINEWIDKPGKYKIQQAWSGVYEEGQQTNSHAHDPSTYSFCYYMRAEAPYTPMVFDDCGVEINGETDLLIVFPSFLKHSVPPCRNERVFISGNTIPTEFNVEG